MCIFLAERFKQANIRKLLEPDFTALLHMTPPALIVVNEQAIPATYWKPQAAKLDLQALVSPLRSDEAIHGAALGDGEVSISVRRK